jgi:iron-sulfur cluster repair protein YtfE (RIC family)
MHCTLDSSVVDWLIDYPASQPVFDDLALDCCCAGRSLADACRRQGLDPAAVHERVLAAIRAAECCNSLGSDG